MFCPCTFYGFRQIHNDIIYHYPVYFCCSKHSLFVREFTSPSLWPPGKLFVLTAGWQCYHVTHTRVPAVMTSVECQLLMSHWDITKSVSSEICPHVLCSDWLHLRPQRYPYDSCATNPHPGVLEPFSESKYAACDERFYDPRLESHEADQLPVSICFISVVTPHRAFSVCF